MCAMQSRSVAIWFTKLYKGFVVINFIFLQISMEYNAFHPLPTQTISGSVFLEQGNKGIIL